MQNKQTAPELRTLFGFMKQIFIELSRCATACQGCCAAFSFSNKKAVTRWLK